jgi:hypothetical protein
MKPHRLRRSPAGFAPTIDANTTGRNRRRTATGACTTATAGSATITEAEYDRFDPAAPLPMRQHVLDRTTRQMQNCGELARCGFALFPKAVAHREERIHDAAPNRLPSGRALPYSLKPTINNANAADTPPIQNAEDSECCAKVPTW